MTNGMGRRRKFRPLRHRNGLPVLLVLCHVLIIASPSFAEEYTFDASEVEKKPYHIGGYVEFYPILFGLDKNSAMYKLNFYDGSMGGTTEQYNGNLQMEASLEKAYPAPTSRRSPATRTAGRHRPRRPISSKDTSRSNPLPPLSWMPERRP
jgi:hypothetical protein